VKKKKRKRKKMSFSLLSRVALRTGSSVRARQCWSVPARFQAASTRTNQHTRASDVDGSRLNLDLDSGAPQLRVHDELQQSALDELLVKDASEVSGYDENLAALPHEPAPFDARFTQLGEDEDIQERHMAPDVDRDVDPRQALSHLLLALSVLAAGVALAYVADPHASSPLGPREADYDAILRATAMDGSRAVPAKFRNGPVPTLPLLWGPTRPILPLAKTPQSDAE
jgi:hypothetical protein